MTSRHAVLTKRYKPVLLRAALRGKVYEHHIAQRLLRKVGNAYGVYAVYMEMLYDFML